MNAERWREITDIFHAALARDTAAREAFLDEACQRDPSMRAEVDALVEAHFEAGSFGEGPVALAPDAIRLAQGTQLGVFRIDALLGVGGMGEVYRATDTKLGRAVAIKVLPDSVARNPDRLARLEREARVLAALNHSNIAAIYGVEEAAGVRALVLELVEGETLAENLRARAVRFSGFGAASRINEALEAAHEKGIVHRDLKPANIAMTGTNGIVKVLDFGLAKAARVYEPDPSRSTPRMDGTKRGTILGTAPYMSPEQVRGLPVDKRTDIWAFGCVLYELLTGRQAFAGETTSDTIAAILEREPDWGALPAATPPNVRRLLRRTLEKNPTLRLRDIGDARIELLSSADDEQPARERRRLGLTRRFAYLIAAATAGVAIAMALLWRPAAPPAFRQLTFRRGAVQTARFTADGKSLVYSAAWDGRRSEVFTRSIDSPESRSLGWPEGAFLFAVSPTNEVAVSLGCGWNVFVNVLARGCSGGTLARAPLAGGAPRQLATNVRFADWTPNGELAVVRRQGGRDRVEFPALSRK